MNLLPRTLPSHRAPLVLALGLAVAVVVPGAAHGAVRPINERRAADPSGTVEVVNTAGTVELSGWDQPAIEVTGTLADGVDHVDVSVEGKRSTVRVVLKSSRVAGDSGDARLVIHVPRKSSVNTALVSADLRLSRIEGMANLQSVSGDVEGEVGQNVQVSVVSGSVHLAAGNATAIQVKSISGDVTISGGGGDVDVATVSGDVDLTLGSVRRGRLKSVSGELKAGLALAGDGQLDGESVSGDIEIRFATPPAAEFAVQTFSGDISNCFGPKPDEAVHGPGSRLSFRNGAGTGHVRLDTKSGDIDLCTRDASPPRASTTERPAAQLKSLYALVF